MTAPTRYKRVLPFWKFLVLIVFTCGLYEVWWFYRAWSFVQEVNEVEEGPFLRVMRAVASALPVVGLFYSWKLFASVRQIADEYDLPKRYSTTYLFLIYQGVIAIDFMICLMDHANRPGSGQAEVIMTLRSFALVLAPLYFLYLPQQTINDYCNAAEDQLPERRGFAG